MPEAATTSQSVDVKELLFNQKRIQLLLKLRSFKFQKNYASALARAADVTYSHTVKCLQRMEEAGLVEFERNGRKKEVFLTDYGREVADELFKVMNTIES